MLRFPVSPGKADDLRRRMAALEMAEADLLERFYCPNHGRLKKRGAQLAVHLRHEPTGLEVRAFKSTSQALNRFLARRLLVRALEKAKEAKVLCEEPQPLAMPSAPTSGKESPVQHMHRMFTHSFEKDVAQPYPIPSQKLLGIGNLPKKLIGVMGERELGNKASKGTGTRRSNS